MRNLVGKSLVGFAVMGALLVSTGNAIAESFTVSTGYYDLTQAQFPPGEPEPNPWVGSPNTAFYGNIGQATSSDPDENAILFQNLGSSAITVSALSFGNGAYDVFSLDNVLLPVTIAAGQNAIFAGNDGSDAGFGPLVTFTVDGNNLSFNDPGNTLHGPTPFGSGDETIPWTQGYSTGNAVPEPSSFALLGLGGIGLSIGTYRRRRMVAI